MTILLPGRADRVSKSMVALVVSGVGALVIAVMSWLPSGFGDSSGVSSPTPGLLQVSPEARGVSVLGDDATVTLYSAGFRVSIDDRLALDTVIRGAPVAALTGSVSRQPDDPDRFTESVDSALTNVRIDSVETVPGRASYRGFVFRTDRSRPLFIDFVAQPGVVQMEVRVDGADGLVLFLDDRPATWGIPPVLPDKNLRLSTAWLETSTSGGSAAYRTMLGYDVAVGPGAVPRAVDLRSPGRHDVHVWSSTARLTISGDPASP